MDTSFKTKRLAKLIQIVENIDDVMIKLASNPRASYSVDTGQGKETVTAQSLPMLRNISKNILADIEELEIEIAETGGSNYTRPSF